MSAWPPITDAGLLARLAMDQDEFVAYVGDLLAGLPARQYEAATLANAVEYPFARPQGSFHLEGKKVTALDGLSSGEREETISRFAAAPDRHPLLAIGSNGSPSALTAKFAHFVDEADREVLVLTGRLHDFDVGAAPQPALYGSMPATLFPSPGTKVRAALLWVTIAQFTQLAWSELSYRLGRLRTRFEVELGDSHFDEVLVFVSRFGAFSPGGRAVALAAVPAERRVATAMTQEQLLDAVAALAIGPRGRAEDLVRALHTELETVAPRLAETAWTQAIPFESDRWTPFEPS
ncbi:MAG TPA: hypothetical protein VIT85_02630 [Solirubrobacterales bacterium]